MTKATADLSTANSSFVKKIQVKNQCVVQSANFSLPAKIQGNEDASIQYLNEQLSQVNKEIEQLTNKKDQISDILTEILQKKNRRQETRDESDYDDTQRFSFISNSRIRSSSYNTGSNKKHVTKFRDEPTQQEQETNQSYLSSQSQKSAKKTNEASNIMNQLQSQKSTIKSKIQERDMFNNNSGGLSHTQKAAAINDTSTLYQSFMIQENTQNLASKQKLNEYNKLKERCLWQHFDYKEPIQDKLKNIDNLEEGQLKDLAKSFGVKSKDTKLLKENLKNINSFLSRNKFPEEYLREFKACIHDKIDVL